MMRIHTGYTINASFRKCTVNCEDINVNNHNLFSRFLIFPRKVSRHIRLHDNKTAQVLRQ